MAHAFNKISAKSAFGTLAPNLYQSDYITNKKAQNSFCVVKKECKNVNSYGNLSLYNRANYLNALKFLHTSDVNQSNLSFGLQSKMNLTNVCTVIDGPPCNNNECDGCSEVTKIDASTTVTEPFYVTNTIDPVGVLFGNSVCGTKNFINFMEYKL